jgi:hypothetical protein
MRRHNRVLLLVALVGMMAGCTTSKPAPEALLPIAAPTDSFSHDFFDRVLHRFVDENGRVDYTALAGDATDLDRYYRLLATYSPDSHPQMFPTTADQLAYWINAYNAATINTVLNNYPIASVADVRPYLQKTGKRSWMLRMAVMPFIFCPTTGDLMMSSKASRVVRDKAASIICISRINQAD